MKRVRSLTQTVRSFSRVAATGPWFDPVALYGLKHWLFPLSRLWAAAQAAEDDVDRFLDAVPLQDQTVDRDRIRTALALTDEARVVAEATDAVWRQRMFAPASHLSNMQRLQIERARHGRRHALYLTRRHFRFLRRKPIPRARQTILSPAEAEARHGALLDGTVRLAPLPEEFPKVEQSLTFHRYGDTETWLRFKSPSSVMNDTVLAHVFAPEGVNNPPTLIFGHGIGVESEHWRGLLDETAALVKNGVRVVRPEAPWHGYRTPPGYYGGERIIEVFPSGALDAFSATIQEWAVLADWARNTSSGSLAFGGTSLGALIAQRAADASADWPERLRPNALLLVTHAGDMLETVLNGDLTKLWGNPKDAEDAGWTIENAQRFFTPLNPGPYAAVPGKHIVSVLGSRDRVTPFSSGKQLLDRWAVPDQNRFIWWRGHFSVPATLAHRDAPIKRFSEILKAL